MSARVALQPSLLNKANQAGQAQAVPSTDVVAVCSVDVKNTLMQVQLSVLHSKRWAVRSGRPAVAQPHKHGKKQHLPSDHVPISGWGSDKHNKLVLLPLLCLPLPVQVLPSQLLW
jgi:hypothetical protein